MCLQHLEDLTLDFATLRAAEPPPASERSRAAHVSRALEGLQRDGQRRPRRISKLVFACALATAAVVGVAAVGLRAPISDAAWLESGELTASSGTIHQGSVVPREATLAVAPGAETELRLPRGATLHAGDGARFVLGAREPAVTLETGSLVLEVRKQPSGNSVRVETREAAVEVVGTRFSVHRSTHASSSTTTIRVFEGIVRVTPRIRHVGRDVEKSRDLHAGESVTVGSSEESSLLELPPLPIVDADASVAIGPSEEPSLPLADASADASEATPATRGFVRPDEQGIRGIRAHLRAGRVDEAKALIRRARSNPRISPAELAIVEAETLLAEGRRGDAIDAYVGVTRRYPESRQAEEALFAAGQLSVVYGGKSQRAEELLRAYLARYPNGRFREDANRLVVALEKRVPKP